MKREGVTNVRRKGSGMLSFSFPFLLALSAALALLYLLFLGVYYLLRESYRALRRAEKRETLKKPDGASRKLPQEMSQTPPPEKSPQEPPRTMPPKESPQAPPQTIPPEESLRIPPPAPPQGNGVPLEAGRSALRDGRGRPSGKEKERHE